jgi:nucleoside-diphosphate kinase
MMTERTLILIKPDGVLRGLIGQILQRFEQAGLKIVGLKILQATKKQLNNFFPKSEEWVENLGKKTLTACKEYGVDLSEILGTDDSKEIGEKIKNWNYSYLSLGPVVAIVLEGIHAIDSARKIIGDTLPCRALPGTIRGDFSINSPDLATIVGSVCKNLVHASDNKIEAEKEINCWFEPKELVSYERLDEFFHFLLGFQNPKKGGNDEKWPSRD